MRSKIVDLSTSMAEVAMLLNSLIGFKLSFTKRLHVSSVMKMSNLSRWREG